jgi:hypothetical protein
MKNDDMFKKIDENVPRIRTWFLKIKPTDKVVRVLALNEKTREYDVEDCDGNKSTIQQTEISDIEVKDEEEIEFLKQNPDKD